MAMAAGAMAGGTSPPSPLRSPAPSLRSTAPSLRSPAPHLHSPSPPIRSPFPAASIPSGEVSGAAAMRGGRGGVRALLSAVKVTDPAALAAMEGLNPCRGQGSCSTPEMGHQEASNGGETRLADTSSTAARSPASSSRTQQHLGSSVLAGKKPQESGEACGEPQRSSDARGEQRATSETRMEQRDGSKVPRSLPTSNKRSKKPQESSEACAEPQRSSETCMEQRDGSEVPRSLPTSNERSKKVLIKNSEKTSLTTGRKRPLSDASGSLRARKAAKVINAKDHFPKQAHLMSEQPDLQVIAMPRSQKKCQSFHPNVCMALSQSERMKHKIAYGHLAFFEKHKIAASSKIVHYWVV